jgi:hypothetical protein
VGSGPTCYLGAKAPALAGVVLHSALASGGRRFPGLCTVLLAHMAVFLTGAPFCWLMRELAWPWHRPAGARGSKCEVTAWQEEWAPLVMHCIMLSVRGRQACAS